MLGDLSKKYEVGDGNSGIISNCSEDAGGKSYGLYQLSYNSGTLSNFICWLQDHNNEIYNRLNNYTLASDQFDSEWKNIAEENDEEFSQLQYDFIKESIYDVAVDYLSKNYFEIDNHSETMKDVVWSRAVQYGPGYIVDIFTEAVESIGYPNLSYVDDSKFDGDMIEAIYLDVCKSEEWTSGSPSLRNALYNRFENECEEALDLLNKE